MYLLLKMDTYIFMDESQKQSKSNIFFFFDNFNKKYYYFMKELEYDGE